MANSNIRYTGKLNKQREIEQRKRKKRRIRLIIFLILIIIIGVCTYLLNAPIFSITEINVIGNNQLSIEDIENISEIKQGDNIFGTIGIVAKVKLKQNGYIKDAKIKKKYPNKIEIEVTERKKDFQILTQTGVYINIDEQGYTIDYSAEKLELPLIVGMDINENEIGKQHRLNEKDLEKMENILQIRQEIKKLGISEEIDKIEIGDEYIVSLKNVGININLGDATNLKNRMYYVNAILKKEIGHAGTIYVNGNLNNGFLPYFSEN